MSGTTERQVLDASVVGITLPGFVHSQSRALCGQFLLLRLLCSSESSSLWVLSFLEAYALENFPLWRNQDMLITLAFTWKDAL